MESKANQLTRTLRGLGVFALLSSGVVFLVQGLGKLNSFERFLSFSGLAVALAGLGIFAGLKLKEAKGARAFLGLAAAATPVLFAQLGAMIYSAWAGPSSHLPAALIVTAPSALAVGLAVAGVSALMGPSLYVGFSAFYRDRAEWLMMLLLGTSAFLLVPTRDAHLVGALVTAQTLALAAFFWRFRGAKKNAGAVEYHIAWLLALSPVAIMLGRQEFYGGSNLLGAAASLYLALVFRILAENGRFDKVMREMSELALGFAWIFATGEIAQALVLSTSVTVMVTAYPAAVFLLSRMPNSNKPQSALAGLVWGTTFFIPLVAALTAQGFEGLWMAFMGGAVCFWAYPKGRGLAFLNGVITVIAGILVVAWRAIPFLTNTPWVTLAVLGIAGILGASWLERNRGRFTDARKAVLEHFA